MTRARRRQPWTFSPDNPTARARTIARGCWHALHRADPAAAEKIRALAAIHGEDVWLTPTAATHEHEAPLTRDQVATLAGVDTPAVAMWGKRGIRREGVTAYLLPSESGLYDYDEVIEFLRRRDTPDTRAPRKVTPCPVRSLSPRSSTGVARGVGR